MNYKTLGVFLVLPALVATLVACDASSRVGPPVPESVIPEGLKDCEFYGITTAHGATIHVIRCPNSSTSTVRAGKNPVYSATIDGPAAAASENGYVSAEDQRRAMHDALIAKIDAEIKRLELKAAELRAESLK